MRIFQLKCFHCEGGGKKKKKREEYSLFLEVENSAVLSAGKR